MDKTIDSFINTCDEMMIAEEGLIGSIVNGVKAFFAFLRKKIAEWWAKVKERLAGLKIKQSKAELVKQVDAGNSENAALKKELAQKEYEIKSLKTDAGYTDMRLKAKDNSINHSEKTIEALNAKIKELNDQIKANDEKHAKEIALLNEIKRKVFVETDKINEDLMDLCDILRHRFNAIQDILFRDSKTKLDVKMMMSENQFIEHVEYVYTYPQKRGIADPDTIGHDPTIYGSKSKQAVKDINGRLESIRVILGGIHYASETPNPAYVEMMNECRGRVLKNVIYSTGVINEYKTDYENNLAKIEKAIELHKPSEFYVGFIKQMTTTFLADIIYAQQLGMKAVTVLETLKPVHDMIYQ